MTSFQGTTFTAKPDNVHLRYVLNITVSLSLSPLPPGVLPVADVAVDLSVFSDWLTKQAHRQADMESGVLGMDTGTAPGELSYFDSQHIQLKVTDKQLK